MKKFFKKSDKIEK